MVDADGHWLEFGPDLCRSMEKVGGPRAADAYRVITGYIRESLDLTVNERRDRRRAQDCFWAAPTRNTLDRATAMLPKLLYERTEELGFDFSVVYPTAGLGFMMLPDDEMRRRSCRAYNVYVASLFADLGDRLTPAAVVPMYHPEEAIEELEYVVDQLGLKVVLTASMFRRPVASIARTKPEAAPYAQWFETLGLDGEYDYDPVWKRCVELRVSPTFHAGTRGWGFRQSPSSFVYNHIGHFAAASEAVCKALFLGGVTRRFPTLKFGFLEGGVGWACGLYVDLIGHWKKRNAEALAEVDPANLDREALVRLVERYAGKEFAEELRTHSGFEVQGATGTGGIANVDDFSACGITRAEDIRDLFTRNFYFGCEADDPVNAWAFNRRVNPFGAKLNTLFGSDIGHFDVPDMGDVLAEAFELVNEGLIGSDDFRDFVFTNPVEFFGRSNPDFFKGTAVERDAAALLERDR